MLEILSKKFESPAHEAQERLRFLTRKVDGGLKAKLRAARITLGLPDLTDSKAKSYWYGAVNDVPSHHMDRLRNLTGAANDNARAGSGYGRGWSPCSAEAVIWQVAA